MTDTELTIWGLGITQNVDAAASTLYLGYRNFSADITCTGAPLRRTVRGRGWRAAKKLAPRTCTSSLGGVVVRF